MAASRQRYIQQHSAGGVVVKRDDQQTYVLLIKPHKRNRWQLPKGTIDPGESPDVTAIREIREEGGVDATVIDVLTPITFFYQMQGQRYVKTVDFYLMEYQSGSTQDHDNEVDDARWFPSDQVLKTLTFESEQRVVMAGLQRLQEVGLSVAS